MELKTFENTSGGLIIRLKIIPNSSRNEIIFDSEKETLKVKITAQPIENKANKALIELLSKKIKTAKSNIQILKGELNKEKTIFISSFAQKEFLEMLDIT